jgi:putative flavoprotein involved in K+ transport
MSKTLTSRIGRRMKDRDTLIGSSPRGARKQGIQTRPRATAADGATVTFADGTDLTVAGVVWATGFRLDHSLIDLPVFDDDGQAVHRRGVTEVPGLYFLGLSWQHTRGSALLGWIKDDARYLAETIGTLAQTEPSVRAP